LKYKVINVEGICTNIIHVVILIYLSI